MLFPSVTTLVEAALLIASTLKVLVTAPPKMASVIPLATTVLLPEVKFPLFTQFPEIVWEKLSASKVVALPMVRLPFIVRAPAAVFNPLPNVIKL